MRNTLLHGFARLGLTLALGLLVTLPVRGTSFDTNSTDLWWNPSESGWGVQLLQEADVIFATMYVYDASNVPTWYVALLNYAGNNQYTGALLATHGPWFGNPSFNPGLVSNRVVGQMTYTLDYVEQGRLFLHCRWRASLEDHLPHGSQGRQLRRGVHARLQGNGNRVLQSR